MMDLVVNKEGMLSIIHDEKHLPPVAAIEMMEQSRKLFLVLENGDKLHIGRLSDFLNEFFQAKDGYIVRMDGWVIAESKRLPVVVVQE